jgi:hypothetical protein
MWGTSSCQSSSSATLLPSVVWKRRSAIHSARRRKLSTFALDIARSFKNAWPLCAPAAPVGLHCFFSNSDRRDLYRTQLATPLRCSLEVLSAISERAPHQIQSSMLPFGHQDRREREHFGCKQDQISDVRLRAMKRSLCGHGTRNAGTMLCWQHARQQYLAAMPRISYGRKCCRSCQMLQTNLRTVFAKTNRSCLAWVCPGVC